MCARARTCLNVCECMRIYVCACKLDDDARLLCGDSASRALSPWWHKESGEMCHSFFKRGYFARITTSILNPSCIDILARNICSSRKRKAWKDFLTIFIHLSWPAILCYDVP